MLRGSCTVAIARTERQTYVSPPEQRSCLDDDHVVGLLRFAQKSAVVAGGFGWLDNAGGILTSRGRPTWVACRMTYAFGLGVLYGYGDYHELVEHGVRFLRSELRDTRAGGWWTEPPGPTDKKAYEHAFVLLAANAVALVNGETDLLDEARDVVSEHFWEASADAMRESFSPSWETEEPYRGTNSNMHTVEAFLATAAVTGDDAWLHRASGIVRKIVHGIARHHEWMLPEHFDARWQPMLDYNDDNPADSFRPYGVTIGHLFEWARLTVQLHAALGSSADGWLLSDAQALYEVAFRVGWAADGQPGFVYTVDWNGKPIVRERLHWVQAEAIAAASVLSKATGRSEYGDDQEMLTTYAGERFLDPATGSWHHELDPTGKPSSRIWQGKPDVYHVLQAALIAQQPLRSSLLARPGAG
jgi:sulfoquinovose isomerase